MSTDSAFHPILKERVFLLLFFLSEQEATSEYLAFTTDGLQPNPAICSSEYMWALLLIQERKKKDICKLGFRRIMWEGRGGEAMLFLLL